MQYIDILIPLIVATIAALPGIFALSIQRKKQNADASSTLVETALNLQSQLKIELKSLREELTLLRKENKRARNLLEEYEHIIYTLIEQCKILIYQLKSLGLAPNVSLEEIEKMEKALSKSNEE